MRYLEALGAAEKALSFGLRLVEGEPRPERAAEHLRKLRARLAESGTERPGLLLARFDHYLEATLVHTGYHLETVRVHLDAGLERLLEPLLKAGLLDERSGSNIWASAERAVDTAGTVAELVAQYRRLVSDVENALTAPLPARRDRGTNRALAFIRDHLGERMTLPQVARVAGFAPGYFSKLLKRREGATFEQYVQRPAHRPRQKNARRSAPHHRARGTAVRISQPRLLSSRLRADRRDDSRRVPGIGLEACF